MTRIASRGIRVLIGLLASLGACAFAQDPVCDEIAQVVAAVPDGFESIKGPVILKESSDYDGRDECCYAKRNLPGANFCTVKPSRFWESGATYACHWTFDSSNASKVNGIFNAFATSLKTCLSKDTWQDESTGPDLSYRAALHGGRHLSTITLYSQSARRAAGRASIVFSFETKPMSARRLKI